jgi:hypothetical protein
MIEAYFNKVILYKTYLYFRFNAEDHRAFTAVQKLVHERQKVSSSEAVEIINKNGTAQQHENSENHEMTDLISKGDVCSRSAMSCGVSLN